jgi:predicted enzyme related to lactoylglutathione lyase
MFGWTFQKWEGPMDYWLVTTGPDSQPGINGGLLRRQGEIDGQAVIAYVCTIDVENIDASIAKAQSLGSQVVLPKMPIPGMGWLVYCKDTEGNIFGMMQADPEAK